MKNGKWIYINMLVGELWRAVSNAIACHQDKMNTGEAKSLDWYLKRREIRKNYKGHPEEKHFDNAEMYMLFSRLTDDDKLKLYSEYPSFKLKLCFKNNDPRKLMLKEVDLSYADNNKVIDRVDYLEA